MEDADRSGHAHSMFKEIVNQTMVLENARWDDFPNFGTSRECYFGHVERSS
jgi:hypothetical protein